MLQLQAAISPCSLLQLQPFGWFLEHGGYPRYIHVIDPFSSREQWLGDGWGMLYAGQVPNKIQTRKHLPPNNSISFSHVSSQRIILTLVSRFHSSYYLCHFWVDCTGNPWFPRGFPPVAPAPFRQLRFRRFRRCFRQVRRFGAQLAAEGGAPGRAAAVWAQLLQ